MKLTRVKATPCGALIGPNDTKTPPSLSLSSLLKFRNSSLHLSGLFVGREGFTAKFQGKEEKNVSFLENLTPPTVSAPLSDLRNEKRMAENFPENLPMPSSADPVSAPDFFAAEFTRTDSDSSAITLDFSKDTWLRCDYALQGKSTEWTDEKHSMYLDYLEASFVDELYHSTHLGGLGMKKNSQRPYSSDQFLVLGDGGQKKIDYERNEPLFDSTADSHVMVESPFFHHFKCSEKGCSVACLDPQEHGLLCDNGIHSKGKLTCSYESSTSLEQSSVGHKWHQDLVGSTAEFSDQNFVEDNPGGKPSRKSRSKRLKTAATDGSSKQQIALPERFHAKGASIGNNINLSCNREGRNALLSDHPEDFVYPKSNIHHFLRGS